MSHRAPHVALRFSALLLTSCLSPVYAQMHHVDKPERVTRAVGVYEWTGDLSKPTASRFVPVSLFINGHFEDAGLYLSRPAPFALQTGDLYAVERAGEPAGLLELERAGRVVSGNALADDNTVGAWYGFGKFTPEAPPKPAPKLKPSAHLPVIQASSDNGRPHLGTKTGGNGDTGEPDHDRPHMTRRGDSADKSSDDNGPGDNKSSSDKGTNSDTSQSSAGSGSAGRTTTASSDSGDDTDRPTLRRRDPAQDAERKRSLSGKKGEASVTAAGPQPGDDPDRPTLSRKPEGVDGPKELAGMPADLHQAVAVSDPVNREVHPFARAWDDAAEKATTLGAMGILAKTRVAAYLAANKLVPSDATLAAEPSPTKVQAAPETSAPTGGPRLQRGKPQEYAGGAPAKAGAAATKAPSSAAKRTPQAAAKPAAAAPLRLQNEQITGYTLSYGGLPTFVYTAEVASAMAQPGTLPTAATHPTVYVTLVAQRLPSGELQPAMDAVTDSAHLDRSPRYRLIDAVDPDASHRASLLFELRAASSRQFALYRLTSAKADQTFTTASIE